MAKKNKSPTKKVRLDQLMVDQGLCESRSKAKAMIMAGAVLVDGSPITKAGSQTRIHARVEFKNDPIPYVSRGGLKLQAALDQLSIDVEGVLAIDLGASTGGFTDCLLQRGARHVYAVDVGYGQLAWKLRKDERVTVMERTNARYLKPQDLPQAPDFLVADLSFISAVKVLAPARALLARPARVVLLIKPQFEAGPSRVGRGGVVRDPKIRSSTIKETIDELQGLGLRYIDGIDCPIHGPAGNVEFLAHFEHTEPYVPADDGSTH